MTATRALGVDLGSRRIGLAVSDPSLTVATPLEVLTRRGEVADDHRAIVAAALEAEAAIIVVGLPLSLSGRDGPAARAARAEAEQLRVLAAASGIEVCLQDERLTTVTAERALDEARVRREERRRVVDKIAATVMLQAWLDGGARR